MNYVGELHCTSAIAVKGLRLHMITSEHSGRPMGNVNFEIGKLDDKR